MEKINKFTGEYLRTLTDRAKKSKIYQPHQLVGLTLAELLNDQAHKSLYMKLAKERSHDYLIRLAKKIAENTHIQKKGAYFMRLLAEEKEYQSHDRNLDHRP
jgi:hypothetical protein